jgi:hypothetical protein
MIQELVGSQDSVVTTVNKLRAEQTRKCGAIPHRGKKYFSTSKHPDSNTVGTKAGIPFFKKP